MAPQVSVIGSGAEHEANAEEVGRLLAERGCVVVTGGLDGLFVADASVIPTIPRANTNLSTVAVAELLAERLAGR